MANIPFPSFNIQVPPFALPPGFPIPENNYFSEPEEIESFCDLNDWFNQIILCGCGGVKDGQNWGFVINGFVYTAIWRDHAPRPPWTRAVWDVFCFSPPCGPCKNPVHLGWFWCWDDVIKVIKSEARRRWVPQWKGPGGQTTVYNTNIWESSSFEKVKGPMLWLDDDYELSNNRVVVWKDKSGSSLKAFQEVEASAPLLNQIGDLTFLQFSGSEWLNLRLKKISQWHLFVVGKYSSSLTNDFGTTFGAMGLESPFSGIDGLIAQNDTIHPKGSLSSWVSPNFVAGTLISVENQISIWEWKQTETESFVGLDAVSQTLSTSSEISNDSWNPMEQSGGNPLPVLASVGRSNRGVSVGENFYWFEGEIAEIILYDFPLFSGQRTQVLNYLREKYGLGAPIGLPNPVY